MVNGGSADSPAENAVVSRNGKNRNSLKFYLFSGSSGPWKGRQESTATLSATSPISAPSLGRDAYMNAALGAAASASACDGKPSTKPIDGVRPAGGRADTVPTVVRRWEDNERYSDPNLSPGSRESGDAIPFVVQRLAQEGAVSFEAVGDEETALPSVRSAALEAYGAARDSTVEYLSPTPLFDLRV